MMSATRSSWMWLRTRSRARFRYTGRRRSEPVLTLELRSAQGQPVSLPRQAYSLVVYRPPGRRSPAVRRREPLARSLERDSLDLVTSGPGRYPPPAARAASGRSPHSSPQPGHAGARRQSARPTSLPFRYAAYQPRVVNARQRLQLTFLPDTLPAFAPQNKDRNRLPACFPPQRGELVGPLPLP